MRQILKTFFHLLYHQLAWGYDWVAWVVSLGRWQAWGRSILPFLPQGRTLELGFGPGHLQITLHQTGRQTFGADESRQMNALASRRLRDHGLPIHLTRCQAQALPFAPNSFDAAVATFPAPFIFELPSAMEIERTLKPGGRLVALLAFRPSGAEPADHAIRALFQLTGQTPPRAFDPRTLETAYAQAGFQIQCGWHPAPSGMILIIEAVKSLDNRPHLG